MLKIRKVVNIFFLFQNFPPQNQNFPNELAFHAGLRTVYEHIAQ